MLEKKNKKEYSGKLFFFCEMLSLLCCSLADLHMPNLHHLNSGATLGGLSKDDDGAEDDA